MEKPQENREENKEEARKERYSGWINAYQRKLGEIKKLQRRIPRGLVDEEIGATIRIVDQERHEIHLKLIALGDELHKSKEDVLVDIIRKNGTLDEYGLPEFSILTDDDLIEDVDDGRGYIFNVDVDTQRPSNEDFARYHRNEGGKSLIEPSETIIVYAIMATSDTGHAEKPDDYDERVKRAEHLAEEVGGKIFETVNSGYHTVYAKILGVIILKKDLEKVAATIRNNPSKYRIGKEYYSE